MKKWIVGAYAASPTRFGWDERAEEDFLSGLYALDNITALEVPFIETLHKFDEGWFLKSYPSRLSMVITLIGATTAAVRDNQFAGLASIDESSRAQALATVKAAHDAVKRANDVLSRPTVIAIQLHSAPQRNNSSVDALAQSLEQIHQMDWEGALITLEHCDSLVPGQKAEKGYMSIDDELRSIVLSSTPTALTINWGRSAIELRSSEGPLLHLLKVGERLGGLMFSGASATDNRCGKAWADNHIPPAPPKIVSQDLGSHGSWEDSSLLDDAAFLASLDVAQNAQYLGVKINPHKDATVSQRVALIKETIDRLESASAQLT